MNHLPTDDEWAEVSPELKRLMPDLSRHIPEAAELMHALSKIAIWNLHRGFLFLHAAIHKGLREGYSPEQVGEFATLSARIMNESQRQFDEIMFDTFTPVEGVETVN
jgi:hypothetical protein